MQSKLKTTLSVAAVIALVVHFTLIFIFVNPIPKSENKLNFYSTFYVYPFFEQGWKLFAPVPSSNYNLFVEYEIGGKIYKEDILQKIQKKHIENKLSTNESLSIALHNSIFHFERNTLLQKKLNGPIKNDLNFLIVSHFVSQYLNDLHKQHITILNLFLLVNDCVKNQQKVYFKA